MRRGVELLNKSIADEDGRPSQPYRSIDILADMHRRGVITAEMRQAGEDFHAAFYLAQHDPLQAADMSRPFVSGSIRTDPLTGLKSARESVWQTLVSVGGPGSPGGSCLWHVIGWGHSLKRWAIEQGWSGRRVSEKAASGILICALGAIADKDA
jgi:hypothetical protein